MSVAGARQHECRLSKVGLLFGALTVVSEAHSALLCRCKCGAEAWYPADITKPTYRHRRMCARCGGRACEICATWINAQAGRQSPTCSVVCRKKRAATTELARYHAVKHGAAWRSVRAAYLQRQHARAANEPAFAEIHRAFQRNCQRRYLARLNADPARRESLLAAKRAERARWRESLRRDPIAYAAHLQASRDWYAALSHDEKVRIFKNFTGAKSRDSFHV